MRYKDLIQLPMYPTKYFLMCFLICAIAVSNLLGQKTYVKVEPDYEYKTGLEFFEKGNYGIAQKHFDRAIENYKGESLDYKANAEFYASICAIELFNYDAEYMITQFIAKYPESPKARTANFEMGKFRYRHQKYEDAIAWFEKVDKTKLPADLRAEYHFKLGYSHFMMKNYSKASQQFFEIKDVDTKYTSPAVYYYSHIAYSQENYETALIGFERLKDDATFSAIVPYYITQILFLQRKYGEVINYAPQFVNSANTKRKPEIARIIGESFYKLKEYDKALPYLELFDEQSRKKTRDDKYLLAYTYFLLGKCQKATQLFEVVTGTDDLLSQNSYYHLAGCYLKMDDKNKARLAFSAASKMEFDGRIKEDALYNYAKLTFELQVTLFNDAIKAFNEYLRLYPNSNRADEVYNYLTLAFMNTHNYKDALATLENIKEKDTKIKQALQRVAFFRALELFNNLEYEEAIATFDKSLTYSWYNRDLKAQSIYWKAESHYRLGNYEQAGQNYSDFILSPGAFSQNEFYTAHYNLGYCYFKQKNYTDAMTWFRKYTNLLQDGNNKKTGDAFNRVGDCFFMAKKYWVAIENYEKALETGSPDDDYALYQKAFSLGLVERPNKKIAALEQLVSQFPNSTYFDDALFELGRTCQITQENQKAEMYFKKLADQYFTSPYLPQALLQLGIIYYNNDNTEQALKYYKNLVAEFPGSPESKNAITGIKNIYVDLNQVDAYFSYIESIGQGDEMTVSEQDSLVYISAENVYAAGNCEKSTENFNKYIEQFPTGNFIINAHYYLAECCLLQDNLGAALNAFEYVIGKPKNTFTENAILGAARISLKMNHFEQAHEYYNDLEVIASSKELLYESRMGLMRSAVKMADGRKIIESCEKVLLTENLPMEMEREARYHSAMAHYNSDELNDALTGFRLVSTEVASKEGAEAKYMVAKILYTLKVLDKAQREIMDFASKGTPHQFWLAKSIILLADIHVLNEETFQAKATLQSLIDNYQDTEDGIIDQANQKLLKLIKVEKEKEFEDKQEDIKLNFEDNQDGKYDKLFEEEETQTDSTSQASPDSPDVWETDSLIEFEPDTLKLF